MRTGLDYRANHSGIPNYWDKDENSPGIRLFRKICPGGEIILNFHLSLPEKQEKNEITWSQGFPQKTVCPGNLGFYRVLRDA